MKEKRDVLIWAPSEPIQKVIENAGMGSLPATNSNPKAPLKLFSCSVLFLPKSNSHEQEKGSLLLWEREFFPRTAQTKAKTVCEEGPGKADSTIKKWKASLWLLQKPHCLPSPPR